MSRSGKKSNQLSQVVNVVMAYVISGILIVYGGVNVSLNILQAQRGMFKDLQWHMALPFIVIFGLLPILAGILVLVYHPATRNSSKPKRKEKAETKD